jgi:putative heme iron utilization protein
MTDEQDILEAEREARKDAPGDHARAWLLSARSGTLCTLSTRSGLEGFPFGSVVPYALDARGAPVILIATIAAHTKNLMADPRASLFIPEPGGEGDPQTRWRLTLTGRFVKLSGDDPELPEIDARYRDVVPQAGTYLETHGFDFWRLETEAVRYIAGFGKIAWLRPDEITRDPAALGDVAGAVDHMNADHAGNMVEMCKGLKGFEPSTARMTTLDETGFLLETDQGHAWFSFGRTIAPRDVRGAIIEVLERARAS